MSENKDNKLLKEADMAEEDSVHQHFISDASVGQSGHSNVRPEDGAAITTNAIPKILNDDEIDLNLEQKDKDEN